ncbi:hypothetical protein [Kitasatospora herbaricolor]|uniref:Uncharacterized protein n=1 Tax=Kitasatospora herbaricolor TaxID=68217 RepID=A0ABZ1WA11_9ACTN|nr:hypothetical protein [Kitasatospora herbaricolor]
MLLRRPAAALALLTALALPLSALATGTATAAPAVAPAVAPAPTAPAGYVPVNPIRAYDTRNSFLTTWASYSPMGPDENLTVPLAPYTGHMPPARANVVPADATAVVVNVTATAPTTDGYLSLSAMAGAPRTVPTTSSVNFTVGQTVSNLVTVPVAQNVSVPGSGGDQHLPTINVYNHTGATHVVIDILGYYQPGAAAKYEPTTPTRLLDTREGSGTKLGPDTSRGLVVGREDLGTRGATAVVLNVTVTDPDADSFLTVFPPLQFVPSTSNINFAPGRTVPNQVVVPLNYGDKINLYNHVGSVHVIVDLVGYYGPTGHGLYSAIAPARLLDSRTSGGRRPPYSSTTVPVAGAAGIPAEATAATLNVTATEPDTAGHLVVHPAGTPLPNTSNVNFTAGGTSANGVTATLGGGGVEVDNRSGATHEIVDVTGWFTNG